MLRIWRCVQQNQNLFSAVIAGKKTASLQPRSLVSQVGMHLSMIHDNQAMSDGLTPRCFKCGEVGHFKRECPKQHSTSLLCFNCGEAGHFAVDCMAERKRIKICYNCGGEGHLSFQCTKEVSEESSVNFTNSRVKCFKCGVYGHTIIDCPKKDVNGAVCYRCGEEGHLARDCSQNEQEATKYYISNVRCFACGEMGHLAQNCQLKFSHLR